MNARAIANAFDVSLFDGNLALLIMLGRVDPLDHPRRFPITNARHNRYCYHFSRRSEIKLSALDELLLTCGIEVIRNESGDDWDAYYGDIIASYLNTGDSYATTILLDHTANRWRFTSWGDFVENLETTIADD